MKGFKYGLLWASFVFTYWTLEGTNEWSSFLVIPSILGVCIIEYFEDKKLAQLTGRNGE